MTRLVFVCPAATAPSGGVRRIIEFAEVLATAGHATVVAIPGGRPSWLAPSAVEVLPGPTIEVSASDVVVVPEVLGFGWAAPALDDVRTIILNQGAYLTFKRAGFDRVPSPYRSPNLCGVVCVSDDNAGYLRAAFPDLDVHRVHLGFDPALRDDRVAKERRIAFMPRRRAEDAEQVIQLLTHWGRLGAWTVDAIDGVGEAEAVRRLQRATVFLHLPNHGGEGFPLPGAEAMAAGCVVVGFAGRGGAAEYLRPEHTVIVPDGDIVAMAKALADTVDCPLDELVDRGRGASEFLLSTFTREREAADLRRAFDALLDGPEPVWTGRRELVLPSATPRWKRAVSHLRSAGRIAIGRD